VSGEAEKPTAIGGCAPLLGRLPILAVIGNNPRTFRALVVDSAVGISPQNRALNYSAMNAHNTKQIFRDMSAQGKRLDTIEVDRTVICRPESDCWDVTYRFFDPTQVLTQARQVFQYTIDVSDLVPVTVGKLRSWQIY
jgi:hypothetical protein